MSTTGIIPIVADAAWQRITAIRASSWGSLFDCAYKWEGEHLMGMRKPSGLRAQLGTAIHAGTALFDNGRLPGAAAVSVDDAAGVFVDTLKNPAGDVDYGQDALTVRDAERIGLALTGIYCLDMSPGFTFASVEQKLQPLDIDCGAGQIVRLTGTMDRARVAMTGAGLVIPDLKTGARAVAGGKANIKGRSAQLGTYQIMKSAEGVPAVGAQVLALKTSGKPEGAVSRVWDARPLMLGTDKAPGLLEHAAHMLRTGLFPPNPQSMLCSPKYCARWPVCPYHESESTTTED